MPDFELFIKYFSGKASFEEAMLVEDFAKSSPDKYAYFQSIFEAWTAAGKEQYQLPDVKKEWERLLTQLAEGKSRARQRLPFRKIAFAAAIAGLLGLSGWLLSYFSPTPAPSVQVVAAEKESLVLSDSSTVLLLPGATLSYPESFSEGPREIQLEGNADFDISHRAGQPFIIHLPHELHIRVTGTSFSVATTTAATKVSLREGSVVFYNRADSVHMKAGQIVSYLPATGKFHIEVSIPERGSFEFRSRPLHEVISELNAYFHAEVQLSNPQIGYCLFSGSFEQETLVEMIPIIAATFNFEYKLDGDKIWLGGAACN